MLKQKYICHLKLQENYSPTTWRKPPLKSSTIKRCVVPELLAYARSTIKLASFTSELLKDLYIIPNKRISGR